MELQRATIGISAKVLANQLRELERDGIVLRHELVSEPPKSTRYELTTLGRQLLPVIDAMSHWGALSRQRMGP
jgi:DNA-binding HxlR family transcriptional regulator